MVYQNIDLFTAPIPKYYCKILYINQIKKKTNFYNRTLMFLLLCSVGNGDIISNEGLLTVAGLKVEQLQENKDEKKEQGIMLLLGGGVGLWTDEDHPWDYRSRRKSSFRHVSVSSGVLAGREKEQKRHH